ncbi:arylsulfatase [Olivibacter domesticus]|uniref:Arylsulfatase n=1 Tax=Olivibacter domesticus TaxID=407022 RepID=A0A1H7GVB4_OLID1|nr:arylsulfatase [Olivibacter domesticus]SEK41437.1 arylsulfatase [Olivibacter domesticus]
MNYLMLSRKIRFPRMLTRMYWKVILLITAIPNFMFAQQADRPNIVVILADDMGYSDLGCYGSEINTPNLNKLAAGGLRFRTFYNAARCCPSRASLLTGLYPHEAGMGAMVSEADRPAIPGPYQGYLNKQSVTLAEVLGAAGYKTYMSGKWHVGERREHWPRQRGFERYFGLISGASSYFELVDEPRKRSMAHDNDPWFPPDSGFYMTDAFTDSAVNFVETHQKQGEKKPFFLYLAYTAPHWPLHALQEDIAANKGKYDEGWDRIRRKRYQRMQDLGIIDSRYRLSERSANIPAWGSMDKQSDWAHRMEVYAAMVQRMDKGIGKLLESLKRSGQLNNTLILFLSDNGACAENIDQRKLHDQQVAVGNRGSYLAYDEYWANASNTPFRMYKAWTEEGGINSPLIVHWPDKIKADSGKITNAVGHIVDIMATCVDVAGATYPETFKGNRITPLKGQSLLPVFTGGKLRDRKLYWEHFGKWAVREGDWKLVGEAKSGQVQLFNLAEDPVETQDLAKIRKDIVSKLTKDYHQWSLDVGVKR